jgi:hypothetical protein
VLSGSRAAPVLAPGAVPDLPAWRDGRLQHGLTDSARRGHRYGAKGLTGLPVRKVASHAAKLTPDQKQQSAAFLERGPDMTTDGVVHRRRIDRQARIKE